MRYCFLLLLFFVLLSACQPASRETPAATADGMTMLVDVHVWVPDTAGDLWQSHQAIVFDKGRVVAVGQRADLETRYRPMQILEGKGAHLLPGLIDAHGHVMGLGRGRLQVNLIGSVSRQALRDTVAAFALRNPSRRWIVGRGWNQELWADKAFPTAADLDAAERTRPVFLERVDGHAAVVNTAALREAGITRNTPDPVGGRILKDAKGEPNGMLVDAAVELVARIVPPISATEDSVALAAALTELRRYGITAVHDAGIDARTARLYKRFADSNRLAPRIYAMIGGTGADFDTISQDGPLHSYGDGQLAIRSVKLYADGALGSRGAALLQPYADEATTGLVFLRDSQLDSMLRKAAVKGYQVNIHAIGDAANRQALNAFERLLGAQPGTDSLRHRIEHAQVVHPLDLPRFKALRIIPSMQPTHATSDKHMAEVRLGPDRLTGAYAWSTLRKMGARLAFGSDFPVEHPNPWLGIYAAVTRKDTLGQPVDGWRKAEALTVEQALLGFTRDAAFAGHAEQQQGTLRPGSHADFILIADNPFTLRPDSLFRVQVLQTWVGGRRVYP